MPLGAGLRVAGIFFLVVLSGVLLGTVSASKPQPPQALVLDLVGFANQTQGVWVARYNFTFQLATDDPDQSVGSFGYTLCGGTNISSTGYACTSTNASRTPTGRAGWVYVGVADATDACSPGQACVNYAPSFTYNVTAWNGTDQNVGCSLTAALDKVSPFLNEPNNNVGSESATAPLVISQTGYYSCGYQPNASAGVAAIVSTPYGSSLAVPSVTNVTWRLSEQDPDQTTGALDYYLFHRYTNPPQAGLVQRGVRDTPGGALDSAGVRGTNVTGFGAVGQTNTLYLQVYARDNLTHVRTNLSCIAAVTEGVAFATGNCGNLLPDSAGGQIASGPAFPMLDVAAFQASTGLSSAATGYLLAGVMIACLGGGGFLVAQKAGGVIGLVLSVIAIASLGLVPLWLLIVVFLGFASVIVLFFSAGKTSGGAS